MCCCSHRGHNEGNINNWSKGISVHCYNVHVGEGYILKANQKYCIDRNLPESKEIVTYSKLGHDSISKL